MRPALPVAAALASLAVLAPSAAAVPVTDLGAWDGVGGFRPVAVSPAGAFVAGTRVVATSPDEFGHAARWTAAGGVVDFTAIGGAGSNRSSGALDVNDAGLVVGVSNTADDFAGEHAFRASSPSVVDLGVLDDTVFSPGATARGVSATGVIVGSSMRAIAAAEKVQGFRLSSGVLSLGATFPAADAAHDVFLFAVADGAAPAAVGARDWNPETQSGGTGIAVTGAGVVSALDFVPGRHGLSADGKWAAGTTAATLPRKRDLVTAGAASVVLQPLAPATTAAASAVNTDGVVVGASGGKAVAWSGTGAVDLNTLLDPGSGWVLQAALDISDTGLVLGYGTKGGVRHGFLLPFSDEGIVVNATTDKADANPAAKDGVCDVDLAADGRQCTLRAAIQTANERSAKDRITFDLAPGAAIRPTAALPALTAPGVTIDGTTAGAGAATIDGRSVPTSGKGALLTLAGASDIVRGVEIGQAATGILLAAEKTVVEASAIGVTRSGTPLPLTGAGITVDAKAASARIGGTGAGQTVRIEHTGGPGVEIPKAAGVTVRGNQIDLTAGLPIDLAAPGPTPNDATGAAAPAAHYPFLTGLIDGRLTGIISAAPKAVYTIDVYAALCGGDRAQMSSWLESFTVSTDARGTAQFDRALKTRPTAVTATATDARGSTSEPAITRFEAADPGAGEAPKAPQRTPRASTCKPNLRPMGIEIVQRVQSKEWYGKPSPQPDLRVPGLMGTDVPIPFVTKYGVAAIDQTAYLVHGISTYAKVYVRDDNLGVPPAANPDVTLFGFRKQGTTLLPLRPASVSPEYTPRIVGRSSTKIDDLRSSRGAYLFRIPDEWTKGNGELALVAGVNRNRVVSECDDASCTLDNWIVMTGMTFVSTGKHPILLLRSTWPGRTGAAGDEARWLADGQRSMYEYQPYAADTSRVSTSSLVLDLAADIRRAQKTAGIPETGKMLECWAVQACQNVLIVFFADHASKVPALDGRWPWLPTKAGPPESFAVIKGYGPNNATWTGLDYDNDGDNVARIAHELGHSIGDLRHVDGCNSPAGPDYGYPDALGRIVSWAFIPPAAAGEPGRTVGPLEARDVMTYCTMANNQRRMSLYSWNKAVRKTRVAGSAPTRTGAPSAGTAATLDVQVVATAAGRADVRVSPSTVAPGSPPVSSPYILVARDAAGATVRSQPIVLAATEEDGGASGVVAGSAVIPAADVASVAVETAGAAIATTTRPASPPTARFTGAAPKVRAGRPTVVRFALGAGVVDATLEVSTNGRAWSPLVSGLRGTTFSLAPGVLPRGKRLRLRIRATDGFRTTTATSRTFASKGAPPVVRIDGPGAGSVFAKGARIVLHGYATLRSGGSLTGKRLTWLDRKRVLGHGERVAIATLKRGAHTITLRATAPGGLVGTARVRITVR